MTALDLLAFALCLAVGLAFAAFVLRGLARLAWAIVGRVWARAAGYDGHVFAVTREFVTVEELKQNGQDATEGRWATVVHYAKETTK